HVLYAKGSFSLLVITLIAPPDVPRAQVDVFLLVLLAIKPVQAPKTVLFPSRLVSTSAFSSLSSLNPSPCSFSLFLLLFIQLFLIYDK
ncbi:hypothetical protein, partial [Clostridium butyricum]